MIHFQTIVVDAGCQVRKSDIFFLIFIPLWRRNKLMSLWHWSKLRSLWHWPKWRSLWSKLFKHVSMP